MCYLLKSMSLLVSSIWINFFKKVGDFSPIKNHFTISERDLLETSDNLIRYFSGPIRVDICCFKEEILISTDDCWYYLLDEFLLVARIAWKLEDKNISKKNNTIIIKIDYNTLKLYLEYSIVFISLIILLYFTLTLICFNKLLIFLI